MAILLVEDNPGDAVLISEMLLVGHHSSAALHHARSLKEAEAATVDRASVATVLLDLGLPDSAGIDTLIAIRRLFPDSAIVVLSGYEDEEMTLRALREGAQSYLTKNGLNAEVLDNTLRYSMERHRFITRLREEEQRNAQLRESEQTFRTALENEKELNALKSRFVAMVSHEFRTPLAIIQSSADLIDRHADGPESAKVRSYTARIKVKVRALTGMLKDVLDLEKLQHGTISCTPEEFDIIQLVDELMAEMRVLAGTEQHLVHEASHLEGPVYLDERMVTNVITNLISNAIKYSPPGATIALRTELDEDHMKITVTDSGVGVPMEDQQQLFQHFFRGSNVGSSPGTGLGLPIVEQYLALMGGTINFTSEPGCTVFVVELPRRMAEKE